MVGKLDDLEDQMNKKIGENFKRIRLGLGLSRAQVAKILDVSAFQITKYERSDNRIPITKFIILYDLYRRENDIVDKIKSYKFSHYELIEKYEYLYESIFNEVL